MKSILALFILATTFLFGSIIGLSAGFNPFASGGVFTVISVFAIAPQGALRAGPDISSVVTQLGAYITVNKSKIWGKIRAGVELYQYCRQQPNVTGYYSSMMATTTELHQAFQKGVHPKGTPSIEAFKNQNFHVKVDVLLDELDKLWDGYLVHLTSEGEARKNWPFVQFIVETALIPKMIEEINDMTCLGSYVAPTPGTPGAYMEAMNGLFTIVTNLVTAGAFTPITVGAMSDANGVDKVKTFMAGIPEKYKTKGGNIFTAVGKRRNYSNHYNTIYQNSGIKDDRNNVVVDSEVNTKIIGLSGAGAANRMIFIPGDPKDKLIHMFNKIANPANFQVQESGRDILLLHDRWDGPGFENLDGIFVSDVA